MIPTEKITLINILALTQYPFRKLIAFIGKEQIVGFKIVNNGTFEGKTYSGNIVTVTLSEEPFCNTNRKLAFKEQFVASVKGSPYKCIQDVEGNDHPIYICTINELPDDELLDLVKGN